MKRASPADIVLIGVAGLVTLMKALWVTDAHADENIYNYAARLIADGVTPYSGFFFAHPPLQPYLLAAVGAAGRFEPLAFRLIPLVATLTIAWLIYALGRAEHPKGAAAAGACLWLLSFGPMQVSNYGNGLTLATAIALGSAWALTSERPRMFVILAVAAGVTRLAVLPLVAAALIPVLFAERRRALVFGAWTVGAIALAHGLCAASWGSAYWRPVWLYHLQKPAGVPTNLGAIALDQAYLLVLVALAGLLLPVVRRIRGHAGPLPRIWQLSAASLAVVILTFAASPVLFSYYLVILYPVLAMLAVPGAAAIIALAQRVARGDATGRWLGLACAGVMLLAWAARPVSDIPRGKMRVHAWRAGDGDSLGRAAWEAFIPSEELGGRWYDPVTRLAWNIQANAFPEGQRISDWLTTVVPPDGSFAADSMQAPLLALRSQRRIVGAEVDLNPQRWQSALTRRDDWLRLLQRANAVVTWPNVRDGDLWQLDEVRTWLHSCQGGPRFGEFESFVCPRGTAP